MLKGNFLRGVKKGSNCKKTNHNHFHSFKLKKLKQFVKRHGHSLKKLNAETEGNKIENNIKGLQYYESQASM